MLVRPARPDDDTAITALYQALVPGDPHIRVQAARISEIAQDPHNHLLVLEDAGLVCGTGFLTLCLDPMYGSAPYAVVENIIVAATARGRGGGRALMAALEATARAARCTKLMLLSTFDRTEAHAFFAALGLNGERKRGFIKYLNRTAPLTARPPGT